MQGYEEAAALPRSKLIVRGGTRVLLKPGQASFFVGVDLSQVKGRVVRVLRPLHLVVG